jgi:3-deoxy-D-manno-octulosonate 8-phosphate phosphatase (KDO 8-P phosphatase)
MNIKIVLTDVDGVLTDGGMYYTKEGDIMKRFFTRDGMGVTLLKKAKISTMIVTKEKNKIIRQWAKKMNITKVYDGILDKSAILDIVCKNYHVLPDEVAYIGDDVNDVGLLKIVGLSAVPKDGSLEAKKISNYICKTPGGYGAFRELTDLILLNYNKH